MLRYALGICALALVGFALAGCGGRNTETVTVTTTVGTSTTSSEAPASDPIVADLQHVMTQLGYYYDWLSRYQRVVTRLGHKGGFDPLTVHRLLTPDRPGVAPADVVHDRILSASGRPSHPRVLDAGCGVGGTVFYLQARLGGRYDGLTLSEIQQKRASREAARRGLLETCRFHVRSYDGDLADLLPDGADLIVAIESLAHSIDPARSLANLARAIRPGGRLALVWNTRDERIQPVRVLGRACEDSRRGNGTGSS